MDQLYY